MLGLMAWLLATRASVWPSGAALATWSEPSMPAAPPLLSMFTGWPQAAVNLAPIKRAARSIAPPGVAGTTIVSGLLGKACANARDANPPTAPRAARASSGLRCIDGLLFRSAHERRALGIELPVRDQALHRHGVLARAEAMLAVELVRLLDLAHVELDAQAWFLRHLHVAADDAQRLLREAL